MRVVPPKPNKTSTGKIKVVLLYSVNLDRWYCRQGSEFGMIIGSGKTKEEAIEDAKWSLDRQRSVPKPEVVYL